MGEILNRDALQRVFGDIALRISISALPHVISRCDGAFGRSFVQALADTSEKKLGAWGHTQVLLQDTNGAPVVEDVLRSGEIYRETWGLPINQTSLRKYGAFPTDQFSMIVELEASSRLLEVLNSRVEVNGGFEFNHDVCMTAVIDNIETLKWAYIPITDEWYFALLIASTNRGHFVDRVAASIANNSRELLSISADGLRIVKR